MTPTIFAIFNFIGVLVFKTAGYLLPIAELYECFALVAVFLLLLTYVAPLSRRGQLEYFAAMAPTAKSSSLNWFKHTWVAVFQIIPVRLITVIAAEILQAKFCYGSKKYYRSHTAISVVQGISTALCLIAIIKFYMRMRREIHAADSKILFRLASFKLIVLIQLVQRVVLNALAQRNQLKGSAHISVTDLAVGLNPFLTCIEAFLFSVAFIFTWSAWGYRASALSRGFGGRQPPRKMSFIAALLDTMNITDIFRGLNWNWYADGEPGVARSSTSTLNEQGMIQRGDRKDSYVTETAA